MKNPADYFRNDMPYDTYEEYLEERSVLLAAQIRAYLMHSCVRCGKEQENYLAILHQTEEKLRDSGLEPEQDPQEWRELVSDRSKLSEAAGMDLAVERIAEKMGIGSFGKEVLTAALLSAVDPSWGRIFSFLNGDDKMRHPTLEACARLFAGGEISPLRRYRLISTGMQEYRILFPCLSGGSGAIREELTCDGRLTELLLGIQDSLPPGVEMLENESEDPFWFREKELEELEFFTEERTFPLFVVCGGRGAGKKSLVRHFAGSHGVQAVLFDGKDYEGQEEESFLRCAEALRYAARECIIRTLPLAVQGLDGYSRRARNRMIGVLREEYLPVIQLIFVLSNDTEYIPQDGGIYAVHLQEPDEIQRIKLWEHYREGYLLGDDIRIEEAANTFTLSPGQIKNALHQAAVSSGGVKHAVTRKKLYEACYAQLSHHLGENTEKVEAGFAWDDLKMDAADKQVLADICGCVRNRHIVMRQWNFSKVVPYGAGVTVLFSGPPGTGKTMAAQVIANELQMELYKIDLSQLMDKYVGETEKNIKAVFEQAQKSNSILFFDEADAIFNKRLDAGNANERFANIESSLLLQCVESYRGISILATNHMQSIDAAFIRRFKYYILFREPDEATRYEIWRSVFPEEAPLAADVDLRLLAHLFEFTGAVIKNIALAAAYLAAGRNGPITNVDILRATRREMQKTNLVLTKEKLGSLGYLFPEIIK